MKIVYVKPDLRMIQPRYDSHFLASQGNGTIDPGEEVDWGDA